MTVFLVELRRLGLSIQYDLSASQFSPDGRVFQVEYANKAVEASGTIVALRCKDGVAFAVEKIITSRLYESGSNKRIHNVDKHIGMVRRKPLDTVVRRPRRS